jgi:hypothetical protein
MKNVILMVPDPTEGGGGGITDLAKIIARLEAMDVRVIAIEKSTALDALTKRVAGLEKLVKYLEDDVVELDGLHDKLAEIKQALETVQPLEARTAHVPTIKSMTKHAQEELDELENNPEKRLALMMEGGVTEEKATTSIELRKKLLRAELGIKPATAGKKVGGSAKVATAIIAFVAALAALFCTPVAKADQQGLPNYIVALTNIPSVINAGSVSNLLALGLTNQFSIHRGAGFGLEWLGSAGSGCVSTNVGIELALTDDGTNYDQFHPLWFQAQCFGTTNVCDSTNFPILWGAVGAELMTITNGYAAGVTNNGLNVTKPQGGP